MTAAHANPRHPVERFLGSTEALGGPFNLLRLGPQECSSERVVASLNAQLARVNDHTEADTPEADEVRLALHAAAAQLLDPNVLRHLFERYEGIQSGDPIATPTRPVDPATAIEADAIVTLARYGGWNRQSLQRLTWLAHARGIPNEQVRDTLIALAHQRPRAGSMASRAAQSPPQPAAPTPAQRNIQPTGVPTSTGAPDKPERRAEHNELWKGVLALVAIALVAIGLGVGAVALVLQGLSTNGPTGRTEPAQVASANDPTPPAKRTRSTEKPVELFPTGPTTKKRALPNRTLGAEPGSDPRRIVRDIDACIEGLDIDPDQAAQMFDAVTASFAHSWDDMPLDRVRAASVGVVEYVYRASGTSRLAARALRSVERHADPMISSEPLVADDIMPAAWSIGMLTRLSREQDLPALTQARIERTLGAALGGHIPGGNRMVVDGVEAALAAMPQRLVGDEDTDPADRKAWRQWLTAVEALTTDDDQLRTRLILRGLDMLVRVAPEPNRDADVYAAIGDAVAAIRWREGSAARDWLVRVFDAPGVTNADLAAITTALATRSSADGFDVRKVIRARDTELRRIELRDQIAAMWGLDAATNQNELSRQWVRRAGEALTRSTDGPLEKLRLTRDCAALNRVALLRWRGDFDIALDALDDEQQPTIGSLSRSMTGLPISDSSDDVSRWAIDYVGARQNVNAKIKLLGSAGGRGRLSSFEAEVIALDALRGSTSRLRSAAYNVALRHATDPAMINALIEHLPRMPRTIPNSKLVSVASGSLFRHPRAQDWPIYARRVLVTALLEAVAAGGEYEQIDTLANGLRRMYAARADADLIDADLDELLPSDQSASVLRARWRRAAGPLTPAPGAGVRLDRVDALASARRQIAKGPIQRFAVEQIALCHLMAFVIAGEQPDRADEVADLLANLRDRRQTAQHVFDQLAACEAAQLRLWMIRFRERLP